MHSPHVSVLKNEVLDAFKDLNDGLFVDCTLGFGGHTKSMLQNKQNIHVIGCDKDENALNFSKQLLKPYENRVQFYKGSFSSFFENTKEQNIKGILADIGVSSYQLDEKTRGFGFNSDVLDMRMDINQNLNAQDVVNGYGVYELEELFKDYAQINNAKIVAQDIVNARKKCKITTPKQLLDIIGNKKQKGRKVSIATLVFQAIRIHVNDELGELRRLLEYILRLELNDCIVGIITFHSLEDKIVKQSFKKWEKSCICSSEVFRCECGNNHSKGKVITKKPIVPTQEEIKQNIRARSAKLRVFRFGK